jgi:hypothetical protein
VASKKKIQKCIACGLLVEYTSWAAGPVCYPCYWGAKLEYSLNPITNIDQMPVEFQNMLRSMFEKGGYSFPFDLIESWKQKPYLKCNTMLRRWWSPTKEQEEQDEKIAMKE